MIQVMVFYLEKLFMAWCFKNPKTLTMIQVMSWCFIRNPKNIKTPIQDRSCMYITL
ncbi:hypothetical protein HanHA89_Chr15g0603981 [Helianthus annuus]|nr:hypothetical protein HanHA89_Chr15g0603981 [Helianthus annuus]